MFWKKIRVELFYLSLLSFALGLCFSFQISNLSNIFKYLGATTTELPLLWLIPPMTGFLVQPLIGQISDDTVSKYGKRRPYLVVLGLFTIFAFSFLPWTHSLLLALLLLLIIDCSLNGSLEVLRTLTGDLTRNENERSQAFALQAFFSGIGGALGASFPFIINKIFVYYNLNLNLKLYTLPQNLRISILFIVIILIFTLFILKYIKEKPYLHQDLLQKKKKQTNYFKKITKVFNEIYKNLRKMPKEFRHICYIHASTWVGIFIFWLYFSAAIAQNIYHLSSQTLASTPIYTEILHKASLDSSYYFFIYQFVSVIFSVFLYFISPYVRIKLLHSISLFIGALGIFVFCYLPTAGLTFCAFIAIGIMWGSVLILPYAIAMQTLPKGKMGAYLGIFNICITAPQIICGLVISPLYSYVFQKQAVYLLVLAGFFILLSAYFWYQLEKQTLARRDQSSALEIA